jgi:Protein of unknown function (DUF3631)
MIHAHSVDPMPAVDGAELLDEVHDTLTQYVVFANDHHQAPAVTLWIAATHAIPAWQHATRLIISSPQKRCGKSRLMDIVAGLSFSPLLCSDATTAAIFRSIGMDDNRIPTLFVDEADALWATKRVAEQNEDLRALFNAGWQRNRPAMRCVGPHQTPTPFNTFAMVAFATKAVRLPDTITDRAVNIDLERRAPGEKVARFRIRRDQPQLHSLREKLANWVRDSDRLDALAAAEPSMPLGIEDRAQDAWEPLIAIADAAGGDWPNKARAACRALSGSVDDDDLGTLLLADIRQIFKDTDKSFLASAAGDPFLPSATLVGELRSIEESPWAEEKSDTYITASKLAKRLKPFGVKPEHNAAKTVRGYKLKSFRNAFRRYLRPEPSTRPTHDDDQHEQAQDAKCPLTVRSRPAGQFSDGSGHLGDTLDDSPETAGQSDISDNWTGPDGTPERNGTGYGRDYRRPGCVCANQPAPCHYCQLAASKQKEELNDG